MYQWSDSGLLTCSPQSADALVCSAACGADLIALEEAERLGIRRCSVLPFSPDRFAFSLDASECRASFLTPMVLTIQVTSWFFRIYGSILHKLPKVLRSTTQTASPYID
jgi:hypothetical protein